LQERVPGLRLELAADHIDGPQVLRAFAFGIGRRLLLEFVRRERGDTDLGVRPPRPLYLPLPRAVTALVPGDGVEPPAERIARAIVPEPTDAVQYCGEDLLLHVGRVRCLETRPETPLVEQRAVQLR